MNRAGRIFVAKSQLGSYLRDHRRPQERVHVDGANMGNGRNGGGSGSYRDRGRKRLGHGGDGGGGRRAATHHDLAPVVGHPHPVPEAAPVTARAAANPGFSAVDDSERSHDLSMNLG